MGRSTDYRNSTVAELEGYRKMYLDDLVVTEAELTVAADVYRSGWTNSKPARKAVEKLARRKVELLEEVAAFDRLIEERTAAAA